jgi:1,4-alpha-glucan branching enzyme
LKWQWIIERDRRMAPRDDAEKAMHVYEVHTGNWKI